MRADGRMRFAGLAAVLLVAAAAAACVDLLAGPAAGPARLALALHAGAQAPQQGSGPLFDEVDGLVVRVTRGQTVVMEDAFAVFPVQGEIRRTIVVMLENDEEDLGLTVELHRRGVAVYVGGRAVRLVRGRQTAAEVELLLVVDPSLRPPDSAVGCVAASCP